MTALRLFDDVPDPSRWARGPEPGLRAVARPDDPVTSRAAAAAVGGKVCDAILAAHRAADGLTDSELCARIQYRAGTVVSARSRLARAGLLRDSGRTRPSIETSRSQTVWRLALPAVVAEPDRETNTTRIVVLAIPEQGD